MDQELHLCEQRLGWQAALFPYTHIQKGSSCVRCGLGSGEALLAWAHTRLLAVKEVYEEPLLLSSEMGSEAVGMGTLFQIRG